MKLNCNNCGAIANLESSKKVYGGRDYGLLYICSNYPTCDSYIGIHRGTTKPLGSLANADTRYWRMRAHNIFDMFWREKSIKKSIRTNKYEKPRSVAYEWLAKKLKIKYQHCHIGMFDIETCKKVVEVCQSYLIEKSEGDKDDHRN
jgi:ssDNA-binding Zn-finger/Zn-ribbon topoisomerase 1